MRILVLGGAGGMASGTIRDLVAPYSRNVTSIVVADTSLERAEGLVNTFDDPRLRALVLITAAWACSRSSRRRTTSAGARRA
jgi:saccharopine dehydrogenase-like NADP-dependent oxidoreductase